LLPHLGTAKAAPKTEKNDIVRARFIFVLPAKTPIEGCGSLQCRPTLWLQFCDNVKSVRWRKVREKTWPGIERSSNSGQVCLYKIHSAAIGVKGYEE